MALIIDGFTHILPKLFAEEFSLAHPTEELRELTGLTHLSDIEMRIGVMDKYKIDKQILTLARPSIWMNIPSTIALKMTRKANDAVGKAAKQFPDRFIGVAGHLIQLWLWHDWSFQVSWRATQTLELSLTTWEV
jgi:predicted TIM-barrel fold metal-dependent hydrolase